MDQKGTKRIRAVNDGQKGTKRTRAVNDGDTATIQPKGRVDVNVTDKFILKQDISILSTSTQHGLCHLKLMNIALVAAATQLLLAVRNGDIATVRRLVTEGHVDVNVTDEAGAAALAAEACKLLSNDPKCHELVRSCILLAVGNYGNWGKEAHHTFSRLASYLAIHQSTPKSAVVAEIYGQLNIALDGVTPLVIASHNGHLEIVKSLIEAGTNVNHTTKVVKMNTII
ncbi:hypothetical protein EMCRGX_G006445 [Ephydatia muelleri]